MQQVSPPFTFAGQHVRIGAAASRFLGHNSLRHGGFAEDWNNLACQVGGSNSSTQIADMALSRPMTAALHVHDVEAAGMKILVAGQLVAYEVGPTRDGRSKAIKPIQIAIPSCRFWAELAVAVGLWVVSARVRSYLPAAAKPAPCGIG